MCLLVSSLCQLQHSRLYVSIIESPEDTGWYQNWFLQNKHFGNLNKGITHKWIQNIPGRGHCSADLFNRKWLRAT